MVDKNKAFIYKNFLLLLDNQQKLIEEIKNINQITQSYFKGCCDSVREYNLKNALLISKNQNGEDIMKFQGKTIHKQKNANTWYTRYRQDGKQYFISGKTQKEVLNKLKLALDYKPTQKNVTTLYGWYIKWLELFKKNKVKQATIDDYEKILKNVNEEIKNKDIRKITSIEVINNLNEITFERTKQKVYELLFALFDKATNFEIVSKNIMKVIEKPKHTREKGIALSQQEQELFINGCKQNKYGDLFLIMLYQGLRVGEVLGLTGNDIDLQNNLLNIDKSINQKTNEYDTTKNQQSIRKVPIFNKSKEILQKYVQFKDERIFKVYYCTIQEMLKKVIKNINLRDISTHDLRHTFITNCKNNEIPEHILQSWVGHTIGSKVTSSIYTHINFVDTIKFIDKINKK